ncbi:hypothetical protein ABZ807_24625 [Micromonospora sp. NPDC047548]|uniref:hypothetical protein n=1 Tax=Micromonospora sp. NPDC047548 TaxID=3155624 RepID=UPI0033F65EEA
MPVHLPLVGVGAVLPGGQFGVEDVDVVDAAVETLPGQGGEFDLCDVEPGAVSGGVVDFQVLRERSGLGRLEGLVERSSGGC